VASHDQPPPQYKTFDTHAAAGKWVRVVEYEMDQGLFVSRVEAEPTTLREQLERYLEEITKTPQRPGPPPAGRLRW